MHSVQIRTVSLVQMNWFTTMRTRWMSSMDLTTWVMPLLATQMLLDTGQRVGAVSSAVCPNRQEKECRGEMEKCHNRGENWMFCSHLNKCIFLSSSSSTQSHYPLRCLTHAVTDRLCTPPPPTLLFPVVLWAGGALERYSLSMSRYFLRSMDTWSLNSTGSNLIWEWTRGMVPNQLANLFMQVWRWAKWSGSAQREARELWSENETEIQSDKWKIRWRKPFIK